MRTNLYHDHAERKYIQLSCDRIGSLKDLWRGPCHSISVLPHSGVRSAKNRGKLEIRQTSVTIVINENARLVTRVIDEAEITQRKTYPIQGSMYDMVRVKIVETFGHIQ